MRSQLNIKIIIIKLVGLLSRQFLHHSVTIWSASDVFIQIDPMVALNRGMDRVISLIHFQKDRISTKRLVALKKWLSTVVQD